MSDQAWQYILVTIGAAAGVLARVGQWRKADGTLDGWRAATECMTLPALVVIVRGLLALKWPDAEDAVVTLIAAFAGLLGTAGITEFLTRYINKKIGS